MEENEKKFETYSISSIVLGYVGKLSKTILDLGIIVGFAAMLAKPWIEPFKDLPQEVEKLNEGLRVLENLFMDTQPRIVKFQSHGLVIDREVYAGGTVRALYQVKREADCQTRIMVKFYNVDIGRIDHSLTSSIMSNKAPISESYQPFIVDIELPEDMPPGQYSYAPEILPIDCGVYKPYNAPISDIFTVKERE